MKKQASFFLLLFLATYTLMAVGVQSHWFSVGSIVSWGQSGVGVVATQSFVNPAYGPNGLKLMSEGQSAEDELQQLFGL